MHSVQFQNNTAPFKNYSPNACLVVAERFGFRYHPLSGVGAKCKFRAGAPSFYFMSRYPVSASISASEVDETICSFVTPEKPTRDKGHLLVRLYGLSMDSPLSMLAGKNTQSMAGGSLC